MLSDNPILFLSALTVGTLLIPCHFDPAIRLKYWLMRETFPR